jgi:hypothetical protein
MLFLLLLLLLLLLVLLQAAAPLLPTGVRVLLQAPPARQPPVAPAAPPTGPSLPR